MPVANRVYTLTIAQATYPGSFTGTIFQILNVATQVVELLGIEIGQSSVTTSTQVAVAILRKTAAATVTSQTPAKVNSGDPASSVTSSTTGTGVNATAEGTDGTILYESAFSLLNGWIWQPDPRRPITSPPGTGTLLAVKFPSVPTCTLSATLTFGEIG